MSDEKPTDDRRRPKGSVEREANNAFKKVDASKAMTEHESIRQAVFENRDRLKAERLAREGATATATKK